jgi:hypothetical protein
MRNGDSSARGRRRSTGRRKQRLSHPLRRARTRWLTGSAEVAGCDEAPIDPHRRSSLRAIAAIIRPAARIDYRTPPASSSAIQPPGSSARRFELTSVGSMPRYGFAAPFTSLRIGPRAMASRHAACRPRARRRVARGRSNGSDRVPHDRARAGAPSGRQASATGVERYPLRTPRHLPRSLSHRR